MTPELAADAELAARLVREAGRLAQRMRLEGVRTETKTSVSDVVTAADRAAERHVVAELLRAHPDDSIVGEEGTEHRGTSGRSWVIDPVDGTYNFVAGLDWWCSALALSVDAGEPDSQVEGEGLVLGAVYHPATDATYLGGPGLSTTANEVPLPRLEDSTLAESCLVTYLHPPYYTGPIAAAFTRVVQGAATVRMLGSGTMDAVAIARGQLGVLCQHSVPPWDELPGAGLIRGVGGGTRRVSAAGVEWYVAGPPTAVAEVCDALLAR